LQTLESEFMTRKEAVETVARHEVHQLTEEARRSLLLDWCSIDAEDPDYEQLPDLLKARLPREEEPGDPMNPLHDPLLELALRRSYLGVVNSFLEKRLAEIGVVVTVTGDVEVLAPCPCCGYRTIERPGEYDICKVCFWEDDGSDEPDRLSGPNHMTLAQARRTFARLGAAREVDLKHVLPDGRERYAHSE
jgi:hypothetical protein